MKKSLMLTSVLVIAVIVYGTACTQEKQASERANEAGKRSEALFKQYCSPCHPDGGNILNPQKSLRKKDREGNGVKTAEDIIGKMRNPGPGMTKFDEQALTDADARVIAEYVLKTFN